MTAQSWRALRDKKYQLSLRLFLFLNAMCALFSLLQPLYTAPAMTIPLHDRREQRWTAGLALAVWAAKNKDVADLHFIRLPVGMAYND